MSVRIPFLVTVLAVVVSAVVPAGAVPRAAESSGSHNLLAAQDLSDWHAGAFYRDQRRDIEYHGHTVLSLDQQKPGGFVAYDLLPWCTIYGLVSYTRFDLPGTGMKTSDISMEGGCGGWVNLLDHDLVDNLLLETKVRLQLLGQATFCDATVGYYELPYMEVYGALTLSVVCEIVGNKEYWPEAIGLFIGPVYDTLQSSEFETYADNFGVNLGLDFYLSRRVTASLGIESYDQDQAVNLSLSARF